MAEKSANEIIASLNARLEAISDAVHDFVAGGYQTGDIIELIEEIKIHADEE